MVAWVLVIHLYGHFTFTGTHICTGWRLVHTKPKQSDTKNKTASHNTPPSKLGQAWISQLKTIYDK